MNPQYAAHAHANAIQAAAAQAAAAQQVTSASMAAHGAYPSTVQQPPANLVLSAAPLRLVYKFCQHYMCYSEKINTAENRILKHPLSHIL